MLPSKTDTGPTQADVIEERRLAALALFDVLDTPRDEAFDSITRLIKSVLDVEIAIVSVIDAHRQWYKSCIGLSITEIARKDTFCKHTIAMSEPLVVPDARADHRFATHPMVTPSDGIRFYAGVPLRTDDGHNIGTVCVIDRQPRDFSTREVALLEQFADAAMKELELRRKAALDNLTGALSRGRFREEGGRAVTLAQRHGHPLSCLIFDLDFFKRINDEHGHPVGDVVLASTVDACLTRLRSSDILGRVGGEEFAIILPHTDAGSAMEVAERLRIAIEALEIADDGSRVPVTASFGVATLDSSAPDFDSLLVHADSACYAAKFEGRNRCVLWRNDGSIGTGVRRRALKAGSIRFGGRPHAPVDCTVRSIGDKGAGLDVSNAVDIPERFNLAIRGDGFEAECRVVSRTERHIEVSFS